jgi:hypothetical protein
LTFGPVVSQFHPIQTGADITCQKNYGSLGGSNKSKKPLFLFCTYNIVSITFKRVSKRSSFRYAFQEHLFKFLMLPMTHSELLLGNHCTSRHFKFKTYNCSSIYQRYQPLYLPNIIFPALCFELFFNLRGKIEKILYILYSFYKPFSRTCLFIYKKRVRQNGVL